MRRHGLVPFAATVRVHQRQVPDPFGRFWRYGLRAQPVGRQQVGRPLDWVAPVSETEASGEPNDEEDDPAGSHAESELIGERLQRDLAALRPLPAAPFDACGHDSGRMRMPLQNHRPGPGLICHSDRGVQYASGDFRRLPDAWRARASMSGKGVCLDNAPMGSFFGSVKSELVRRTRFGSRREARAAILEFIAIYYYRRRRHAGIGYRTPEVARIGMTITVAAW